MQRVLGHRLAFGAGIGAGAHAAQQRQRQEGNRAVVEGDVQAALSIKVQRAWSGFGGFVVQGPRMLVKRTAGVGSPA